MLNSQETNQVNTSHLENNQIEINQTPKKPALQKFLVRFPFGMRTHLSQVASQSQRSMNKEIIARLEHSLANFSSVSLQSGSSFFNEPSNSVQCTGEQDGNQAFTEVMITEQLIKNLGRLSFDKKLALLKIL